MIYRDEESYLIAQWDAMHEGATLCSDCPPVGYPTDSTRCDECPRKSPPVVDIPQVADNATTDSVNGGENTYFQRRSGGGGT